MVYTLGRHNYNLQHVPIRFWRFGRFIDPQYPKELEIQPLSFFVGPLCVTYWQSEGPPPPTRQAPSSLDRALQEAAKSGDTSQLGILLTQGANVRSRDEYGVPVLMYAVSSRSAEDVTTLLAAGADPDSDAEESHINALMWATSETPEIVQALLEHGANPNVVESHSEAGTALLWAFRGKKTNVAIAKLLISYGADVNRFNYYGETPLILAVRHRIVDLVPVLLAAGADPNIRAKDGTTAWTWGSQAGKSVNFPNAERGRL